MQSLDKLYSSTQDVDNTSDLGRQRVDHVWRFRPPIAGRSGDMTYSYYNGSLVLELHVRLRGINSEPCNFCARLQSLLPEIYDGPSAAGGQVEIKLPLPDLGRDYIEQPMLVKIIEVAEQGEEGRDGCLRLYGCNLSISARAVTPKLLIRHSLLMKSAGVSAIGN